MLLVTPFSFVSRQAARLARLDKTLAPPLSLSPQIFAHATLDCIWSGSCRWLGQESVGEMSRRLRLRRRQRSRNGLDGQERNQSAGFGTGGLYEKVQLSTLPGPLCSCGCLCHSNFSFIVLVV